MLLMDDINIKNIISSIQQVCASDSPLPLHEPEITELEKHYLQDCLDSGWISSAGKYVDQFEQSLQQYTGAKYAIATVNGTSALHICLLLAGIRPGEEVLVPNLTFIATANAVCYASATPHFIDVSEKTLGVDPDKLSAYLTEIAEMRQNALYNKLTGRRISALVVMHSFGHPCDMEKVLSLCDQFKLKLIEDAAESLGSFYRQKHTGNFGVLAALSFNGNKIISSGGGGAILTNNKSLAQQAKHITTTAKIPNRIASEHDQLGYNYRLPNLNAALGLAQLKTLENKLSRKRLLAKKYWEAFKSHTDVTLFQEPEHCQSNYWLNLLLLNSPSLQQRDQLIKQCHQNNIYIRPAWGLMHTQAIFVKNPHMPNLNVSEKLFDSLLCLPSSPQLIQP